MIRLFPWALATSLALMSAATAWAQAPAASAATGQPPAAPLKTLRYAFRVAETGFDPAQTTDLYSAIINANIFEAPLTYDFLARPAVVKPQTAAAMPEMSADFKRWTVRIRPGIFFADDPAFKGRPRELTAQDYVYSIKRHYDPRNKSGRLYLFESARILGLSELRRELIDAKKPFDYDREVEGLKALDRYTLEVRFAEPQPRFSFLMADGAISGAVAREVIEAHPGRALEYPVGTGPFRLAQWTRSSKIVLERNPRYREHRYDEQAPANDAASQAIAQRLKGRRLPMLDRVEISIIEEPQPRWLSFLDASNDLLDRLPEEFSTIAVPHGRLAPNLEKQGIQLERVPGVDVTMTYFGMEHPVVGGYTPDKVALRRAIALAYSVENEIQSVRRSQAIPSQGVLPPLTSGYDPELKTEMSDFDPARAKALLDLFGYVDKDGDGWRDLPDGRPLLLEYASQPDFQGRQLQELWKKAMNAINVRIEFQVAKWPENLKASRAGKLMMWGVAWSGLSPDGDYFLGLGYGPNKGQANHARFDLPAFNRLHRQQLVMADGPEREAVMKQASTLMTAYMPYKFSAHRIITDMSQPWVVGYRRHPFMRDFWRFVDIDTDEQQRRAR
jgi:ABC-type transport system substrate-binding protein